MAASSNHNLSATPLNGMACLQACSAVASFSSCPWLQASLCSLSLDSSHWMVLSIYVCPRWQGTWYITMLGWTASLVVVGLSPLYKFGANTLGCPEGYICICTCQGFYKSSFFLHWRLRIVMVHGAAWLPSPSTIWVLFLWELLHWWWNVWDNSWHSVLYAIVSPHSQYYPRSWPIKCSHTNKHLMSPHFTWAGWWSVVQLSQNVGIALLCLLLPVKFFHGYINIYMHFLHVTGIPAEV